MKKSLFDNPYAFAPIFDTVVGVEGARQDKILRGQFRACVFEQGLMDPLAETDSSSERRVVSINVPSCGADGWIGGRPQVGDRVMLEDGTRFRVCRVSHPMGGDWAMEAREA